MKYIYTVILIAAAASINGCATIVSGTDQNLTFDSEPDGATVSVAGEVVGKTPTSVQLKKKTEQSLTFEKEGYKTHTTQLATKMDGWFWGNILLGGLIGSTTDGVSGAANEYAPDHYYVTLTPESTFDITMTRPGQIKEMVMAFGDEIRLELATGGGERTDALMVILGTVDGEKETTLLVLKKLAEGNSNDLDFARSIIKFYIVE